MIGYNVNNMEITKKTKRQLRIQGWIFTILFLVVMGLLAWLSTRYNKEMDWTATGRHSLSEASIKVLDKLDSSVNITSYASGGELSPVRQQVRDLIKRYQKISNKINLEFVDPMTNPDKIRELAIRTDGEMIVEYQSRTEHVQMFSEEGFTNSLQRLLRNAERQIVFITGHGERSPDARANHDMSIFIDNLKNKGFKVSSIDLTKSLVLPPNIAVLVIASPQLEYLEGETQLLKKYVEDGGNLLWLIEPGSKAKLTALANTINLKVLDGVVVDLDISLLGVNDPTIVMGQYGDHAITNDFGLLTLYPRVVGLDFEKQDDWQVSVFLESIQRSWLERGVIKDSVSFSRSEDIEGPVKIGLAMSRELKSGKENEQKSINQRIVVMGDGDFLSNAYLGNQGNQNMGENIINWLTHDDNFIDIPARTAPGSKLVVDEDMMILLGASYLLVIPVLLVGSGVFIWLRRRKR